MFTYNVCANLVIDQDTWSTSRQVPTFQVNASSEAEAESLARRILTAPLLDLSTVTVYVTAVAV